MLICCLTVVQYKNQEIGTDIIHRVYSDFFSNTGTGVCVCVSACV